MMTNKEILEKAIQKAIDNGWEAFFTAAEIAEDLSAGRICCGSLSDIILDHDFAKALWGDKNDYAFFAGYDEWAEVEDAEVNEDADFDEVPRERKRAWQYYLQNMVISDDPIKYLGDNI